MNVALHSPRVLSLCSGTGGLELGLKIAVPGARTVCYVEREAYAAATLVARMEDATLDRAPIWDDVKTFDGAAWRGAVDIVTAGYPCQPFSTAGKQLGDQDERHLWPDIARVIREAEPGWVFLENVPNHLRLGFEQVSSELRDMGYRVEAGLFSAAEAGAPHPRRRLFALAYSESRRRQWDAHQRKGQTTVQSRPDANRRGAGEAVSDTAGNGQQGRGQEYFEVGEPDWWSAEPDIHRVAHGLSYQSDRLRLTGNGVVPVVAALAYISLRELLT